MTKYFCLMFWKQVLNVLLPLPNIDCPIKPFQCKYPIVSQEVQKLLDKGVITKASTRAGQILSSIFLRPKKDGSNRLIFNLKRFNESVSHYHFKMDSLSTITKFVTKNCLMASVDMKDAYYSIPIKPSDRKYLRFMWEGNIYEFSCLPNGLSCAPRIFSKILKPPLSTQVCTSKGTLLWHISMTFICKGKLMRNVSTKMW